MFLSIITINRNNADGLKKTLESVASQICKDYEHIIIDGASTDESVQIIKDYVASDAGKNVSYWVSENDTGVYNAMNKGIKHAKGEYCLFLNSGDWFINNNVIRRISSAEYNDDIIYFDAIVTCRNKKIKLTYPDKINSIFFFSKNTLNHQNVIIKSSLQKKYLFNEEYKIVADACFFMTTILKAECTNKHEKKSITYFDGEVGISSSSKNFEKREYEWNKLHDEFFPKYVQYDLQELIDYKYGYLGILTRIRRMFYFIRKFILTIIKKDINI